MCVPFMFWCLLLVRMMRHDATATRLYVYYMLRILYGLMKAQTAQGEREEKSHECTIVFAAGQFCSLTRTIDEYTY